MIALLVAQLIAGPAPAVRGPARVVRPRRLPGPGSSGG
jgi:hypothetical protein